MSSDARSDARSDVRSDAPSDTRGDERGEAGTDAVLSDTKVNVFKERIFPIIFMFLVTAFFIALVSGIYLATQEEVERNQELYLKSAVLYAAGIDVSESAAEIEDSFERNISEIHRLDDAGEIVGVSYYEVGGTGIVSGYVLPIEGPGLWGEISGVAGFQVDLETMTGIDFTDQNETPGLGGRITEVWFKEQFRGKRGPFTRVPEGTDSKVADEFDSITGATITSTAIQKMLNETYQAASEIVRGR